MPQVGNRKFPYTKEGEQEAAAYAAETGQEVVQQDSYGYARGGEFKSPAGQYEDLRQQLKEGTGGLGGLILTTNKETGEEAFVITYAGSDKELKESGHSDFLNSFYMAINQMDVPKIRKIQLMSEKKSKAMSAGIEKILKNKFGYGTTRG